MGVLRAAAFIMDDALAMLGASAWNERAQIETARIHPDARRTLAVIYVRTGGRRDTLNNTLRALSEVFPEWGMEKRDVSLVPARQVKPYGRGGAAKRPSREFDLILTRRATW